MDFRASIAKKWIVYCKAPYKGKNVLIKYFARYTNRCGVSDSRILGWDGETVLIKPKRDSAEPDGQTPQIKKKQIELPSTEFFKRFFNHILPRGFHRIRYYGLSSPRCSKAKIEAAKLTIKNRTKELNLKIDVAVSLICPRCASEKTHVITTRLNKHRKAEIRDNTS